jgi:hypothetical protein
MSVFPVLYFFKHVVYRLQIYTPSRIKMEQLQVCKQAGRWAKRRTTPSPTTEFEVYFPHFHVKLGLCSVSAAYFRFNICIYIIRLFKDIIILQF